MDLLNSLKQCKYPDLEVIVVDNGSSQPCDELLSAHPWIKLLKTGKNLGFAGGNNEGFKVATGKYFLMLNNDTEVDPDFLFAPVKLFEENPAIGCVSSKLIYHHTPGLIQYAGHTGLNPITGRGFSIGFKEQDQGQYNDSRPTGLAHGAAMMVSRKVMDEIGMMADLYFLYYEEIDYCERIKRAGFQLWFCGGSVVYHKESMTVGKSSPLKTYYMSRNRLVFMKRNYHGLQGLLGRLFHHFVVVPKNLLQLFIQKDFPNLKAYWKGYAWNFSNSNIYHNPGLK